jgi:hypothetical protein
MTGKTTIISVAGAALIALHAEQARSQAAPPPPPPRVAQSSSAATSTPAAPVAPLKLLATSTVPTPPKVVVPASVLPPKDSAVALCNNGTFVMRPGTTADCASRGGLKIAMAHRATAATAPVRRAVTSQSVRPATAEQAPPAGATMRCKDGTYLTGVASADRCSGNGGLAVIFPVRPVAPTAPAAQKRP